jgi:hypothetical protein
MKLGNFSKGPMLYNGQFSPIVAYEIRFGDPKGYGSKPVMDYLRYFFSMNPLELTANGNKQFVEQRSAIKVHPGTEVKFNMDRGAKLYEIQIVNPEKEILENLATNYKSFFYALPEKNKKPWDEVSGKDLDYVIESERNSNRIEKTPGIVIAPAFSRHNHHSSNGWHLLWPRASRVLAIGSDYNFEMRAKETPHKHDILTEIYFCLGNLLELQLDGNKVILSESDYMIVEPGEVHLKTEYITSPHIGLTLQLPSIPRDRRTPEGVRIDD